MTREEIFEGLNEVFSDVFDEEITVTESTTADDIQHWRSKQNEKCGRNGRYHSKQVIKNIVF